MASKAFAQINTVEIDQNNHRFKIYIDIWADTPYGNGQAETDWFTLSNADSGTAINAIIRDVAKTYAINTMGATFDEFDTILLLGGMDTLV